MHGCLHILLLRIPQEKTQVFAADSKTDIYVELFDKMKALRRPAQVMKYPEIPFI